MAIVDILCIVFLVFGGGMGFKRGLLATLASLSFSILGFGQGIKAFHFFLPLLQERSSMMVLAPLLPLLLAVALSVLGILAMYLVNIFIKSMMRLTLLGIMDGFLGCLVGLFQVMLVISCLTYFSHLLPLSSLGWLQGSLFVPFFAPIFPKTLQLLAYFGYADLLKLILI